MLINGRWPGSPWDGPGTVLRACEDGIDKWASRRTLVGWRGFVNRKALLLSPVVN